MLIRLTIFAMVLTAFSPLATSTADQPPGGTFVDDDTSLHEEAIEAIATAGITRGCNPPRNSRFCPEAAVTRGEMAAFLARALDLPAAPPAGFTDTTSSVFQSDIDRLATANITKGCNPPANNRYCPDAAVTRGEMAAFLARALDLPAAPPAGFTDTTSSVFQSDIDRLATANITKGCNPPANNRYCPNRPVTRAEMATFLTRALGLETNAVTPRPYVVDVVDRTEWGAADPHGEFTTHTIERITVHHAGTLDGVSGPQQFRNWQSWHHYLGWPDLAYHFIVGRDGRVYEGRPYQVAGDTATEYDPTGHFLIVVEGNFDEDVPTAGQLEMLAQMVAWASLQFDVPVATITGHRDHAATSCPGANLYAKIEDGSIAARAAQILEQGGVTVSIGPETVPDD